MNRVTDVVEKWRIGDHLFTRKQLSVTDKTKRINFLTLQLTNKRTGFVMTATRYDARRGQKKV
jgi:hypothetical protein